jgi:hypothetical protein
MKAKNSKFFLPALLMLALMTLNVDCGWDLCKRVDCGDNGTCMDGVCLCIDGYSGDKCEVASITRYKGRFAGSEQRSDSTIVAADWTIAQTSNFGVCKITINSHAATDFSIQYYSFIPKQTYFSDSTHILRRLSTKLNDSNDTMTYTATYKIMGTTDSIFCKGKLVRVP